MENENENKNKEKMKTATIITVENAFTRIIHNSNL